MDPAVFSTQLAPPIFDGTSYQVWAVKMEAYLDGNDLREAVEDEYEVSPLPNNPTVAQMKLHKERRQRKSKAKATLFAAVTSTIFTRIMTMKTTHEIWNFLKGEYEGDERIKGMRMINLIREFEMQKMKESETIKDYSDRLLAIANKVRLIGTNFDDSRIVQKILVTVPDKFEVTISSLENTKDVSKISLAELLNVLQAQEQRKMIQEEGTIEGALLVKTKNYGGEKYMKHNNIEESYPPCPHCKKTNHPQRRCWWRPDVKCRKCGQIGHMEKICKSQEEGKIAAVQNQGVLKVDSKLDLN
ncbi:hypothetical protein Syun_023054 [Stephania yunnanensis]|uniref:CCHC-type domain-containing protein n=1 Tax=Stephania yunnanensis TaxID=152371 RepID=A0AAP0FFE3_9MAGN